MKWNEDVTLFWSLALCPCGTQTLEESRTKWVIIHSQNISWNSLHQNSLPIKGFYYGGFFSEHQAARVTIGGIFDKINAGSQRLKFTQTKTDTKSYSFTLLSGKLRCSGRSKDSTALLSTCSSLKKSGLSSNGFYLTKVELQRKSLSSVKFSRTQRRRTWVWTTASCPALATRRSSWGGRRVASTSSQATWKSSQSKTSQNLREHISGGEILVLVTAAHEVKVKYNSMTWQRFSLNQQPPSTLTFLTDTSQPR